LLTITGEQGSAKTFLSKLLRALVDPNVAAVRALPREERELMIAANNGPVLAFVNLSALAPPICCGSALNAPARQQITTAGPKIPAPSLATCAEQTFLRALGIEITLA
jgi:hypothetical protein